MKRFICAVAACLLLCGCGGTTPEATETTRLPAVAPTEPSGSYLPGSEIELATDGAVRVYPQNLGNISAIKPVGDDLLVFSDRETTTITRLTGENLFRIAEIRLDKHYSRFYVGEEQVICYDSETRELVYLNQDLRETGRMAVPEEMLGEPVLTSDRTRIYYCTSSGVYCLETETGISRLVKEMTFARQYTVGLHMGDTVLQVETMDRDGNTETLFLDSQTGSLLGALPANMRLSSAAEYFYATKPEGALVQMIFGTAEEICQLHPGDYRDSGVFLPEVHAALVFDQDDGLTVDYYDLSTGLRTSSLRLGDVQPGGFVADGKGNVYFLADMGEGTQNIFQWNLTGTAVTDGTVYTGDWYTYGTPDTEGLAACREYAEGLSSRFGPEIELITEAIPMQPGNYDLIPEYQVPVIMDALTQLEKLLANYPAGMFAACVEGLEDGKLRLLLVREIRSSYDDGAPSPDGLHFWQENHSMVVLAIGENLEQGLYRNLYHALESRLLSASTALYRWDELNPKGFVYDCDLEETPNRDTGEFFETATRSFVDRASMQSPKKDRATVMAFACMPGKEDYFLSYTMQQKLRALCRGIREAYGLEQYPEPLLWEQYLESPIMK